MDAFKLFKEKDALVFKPVLDTETGELWEEITFIYLPKTQKLIGGKIDRSNLNSKMLSSKNFVKKVQSIPGFIMAVNVSNLEMAQRIALQWMVGYPKYRNMSLLGVVEKGAFHIVRSSTIRPNSFVLPGA